MNRRVRIGVIVLMVCALVRCVWQVVDVVVTDAPAARYPTIVAEYDGPHYAGLVEVLPAREVAGYITDDPDSAEAARSYFLSQYVLAPCVLVQEEEGKLILVDDPPDHAPRPSMAGRRLLRDLGNGVRLFGLKEPE
jgi:hypothetical protein